MKHLVVLGGTGYLGRHIVNTALGAGWRVTSLSKSGGPPHNLNAVYYSADVFKPLSYQAVLQEADAVVHSMGTIFENPLYKQVLNGTPLGFQSLPCKLYGLASGANPMKNGSNGQTASEEDGNGAPTFERMNRDSAIVLAQEFAKVNGSSGADSRRPFVFISAEDWNPLASKRYISTKRQAEDAIETEFSAQLRPVFFRPGFMYDDSKSQASSVRNRIGSTAAAIGQVGSIGAKVLGDRTGLNLRNLNPSVSVQTVAKAVVESLDDPSVEGVVSLEALQNFASLI